jgi:phospholipid transport system substrate-binding protein
MPLLLEKNLRLRGPERDLYQDHALAPGYSQVNSQVNQPNGGNPLALDYRLKYEDGEWKIYDVTVDAISIIANYHNQFNRVINDKGFPTLMTDLRTKSSQLANSLGEPGGNR